MMINDNNYDNTVDGHDEENNILWSKYNLHNIEKSKN